MQRLAWLGFALLLVQGACTRENPGLLQGDLPPLGGGDASMPGLDLAAGSGDLAGADLVGADLTMSLGDLVGGAVDQATSDDLSGADQSSTDLGSSSDLAGDLCQSCTTLATSGATSTCGACAQCAGDHVCGDGVHYGTQLDTRYVCTAGTIGVGTACKFGCNAATGACRDMVPANQAAGHLDMTGINADVFTCSGQQNGSLDELAVPSGAFTIDTTARTLGLTGKGRWGTGYKPSNATANAVVVHLKSLTVASGATVTVTGSRSLIVLVDGDVNLSGATILLQNGPGPITVSAGSPPLGKGGNGEGSGGAGGAGHGTAGKAGGADGDGKGAGAAGPAYHDPDPVILDSGEPGGNGGNPSLNGKNGLGGAGGGGLQISACGTLTMDGTTLVNGSGAGGAGAVTGVAQAGGGGGGGSGGTIIFEAATLAVAGRCVANGGGGGEGGVYMSTTPGGSGKSWDSGTVPATAPAGGGGVFDGAGDGGRGGADGLAPGVGNPATDDVSGGGGGGGAVGRIYLNTSVLQGKPTLTPANFSPQPRTSRVCLAGTTCTYAFDP